MCSCGKRRRSLSLEPCERARRPSFVLGERRLAYLEPARQAIKLDAAEHVPLLAPLLDIPRPEDSAANLAPRTPTKISASWISPVAGSTIPIRLQE